MTPHAVFFDVSSLLATAWVAGLWQGAALAVLAAGLMRLMPRASASVRHSILLAVFLLAAILPWVHFSGRAANTGEATAVRLSPWFAAGVALLWLGMACGRALQLFFAWRHLRAVRQDAVPIVSAGEVPVAGSRRRALLCASTAVDSPTILGFRKPRLLLPEWMLPTLTANELRQIALHECEHLRRRDDWLNLLLQVGLMLSPLNPALVWLNRRIGVQRELACDEAVVASTAQPIAYASCLTRLAEQRIGQRSRLTLALAAWERRSELGQRVHALLRRPAVWSGRQTGFAATAAGVALMAASAGFARVPQFVRIAGAMSVASVTAPATVLPAGMPIAFAHAFDASKVKMVPASFPVRPEPVRATKIRVKRPAWEQARRVHFDQSPAHGWKNLATQPRFLRTSATIEPNEPSGAAAQDGIHPAFITTEFSTPYVAVPVANGWLVIQL